MTKNRSRIEVFGCLAELGLCRTACGKAAIAILGLCASLPAYAYLGPGAGLGMMGSLIAVIVVLFVVVFGLVLYPIRMLRKRRAAAARDGGNETGRSSG